MYQEMKNGYLNKLNETDYGDICENDPLWQQLNFVINILIYLVTILDGVLIYAEKENSSQCSQIKK